MNQVLPAGIRRSIRLLNHWGIRCVAETLGLYSGTVVIVNQGAQAYDAFEERIGQFPRID
jgi:hypothetical protein